MKKQRNDSASSSRPSTAKPQAAPVSSRTARSPALAAAPRATSAPPASTSAIAAKAALSTTGPRRTAIIAQANRLSEDQIKRVWTEYHKSKREHERNILMEHYLHVVRFTAERIHMKLPDEVELDDLMSSGIFGLMDAINAFDADRGVKFETYCSPRIRGAILDELRSMDWVPRLVRSRSSKLDAATKELEMKFGRGPTREELAKHMNLPMAEFEKLARDASAVGVVSLTRKWFETDSNKDVREIDVLEDKRGSDPFREVHRKDLKELMTKGLSRAERLIVVLYYFEEMTMKEIGATLDLSESRVSQMHSSIIARMKAQMGDRRKEFEQAVV